MFLKKNHKPELEIGQYKKFMEMLRKIQVNIPLCETLEQMPTYAKFMKELLSRKRKFKKDENIVLVEEYNVIIQRNLPPKLTNPGRVIIP